MTGGIYLIKDEDVLVEMTEHKYDSEDLLRGLLDKYPLLLAGDQINSKEPRQWLPITREKGIPDSKDGAAVCHVNCAACSNIYCGQSHSNLLLKKSKEGKTTMRKRLLVLLLCAVMVSAIAVTGAVSAKNENNIINSSIRQYNVLWTNGEVIGKVTIDGETGHYIVNVNLERVGLKDAKGHIYLWIVVSNSKSFKGIIDPSLGSIEGWGLLIPTFINAGGIGHVDAYDPLVQQWFGGGAVDGATTVVEFSSFDVAAYDENIVA